MIIFVYICIFGCLKPSISSTAAIKRRNYLFFSFFLFFFNALDPFLSSWRPPRVPRAVDWEPLRAWYSFPDWLTGKLRAVTNEPSWKDFSLLLTFRLSASWQPARAINWRVHVLNQPVNHGIIGSISGPKQLHKVSVFCLFFSFFSRFFFSFWMAGV